jgi:putative hemolysin
LIGELAPQLVLVAGLVVLNAVFAGSELALVSLREGQLQRLESRGGSGVVLARLARDPNRFLATIQIGITLAGFLASASAAVVLAEPVEDLLVFLGPASRPASIVAVTVVLSYVTLVLGELAPKRIAMQRAERWGLLVARPLAAMARVTRPVVWLLSRSADLAVRAAGGDPSVQREEVTEEELRDLVAAQVSFSPQQRLIISGAFEIAERSVYEVLRPRRDVVVLDADLACRAAIDTLIGSGHSRAPVADQADLDRVVGVVHLRDLVAGTGTARGVVREALFVPESAKVLDVLRLMQTGRHQLAVVINEHGGGEGIITVEDLLEELVGEIYDETDRDVLDVVREPDGSMVVPGRFPAHDLIDLGIDLPAGDYATVAGLALSALGRIPEPGEQVVVDRWELTVLEVQQRSITRLRLRPTVPDDGSGGDAPVGDDPATTDEA